MYIFVSKQGSQLKPTTLISIPVLISTSKIEPFFYLLTLLYRIFPILSYPILPPYLPTHSRSPSSSHFPFTHDIFYLNKIPTLHTNQQPLNPTLTTVLKINHLTHSIPQSLSNPYPRRPPTPTSVTRTRTRTYLQSKFHSNPTP